MANNHVSKRRPTIKGRPYPLNDFLFFYNCSTKIQFKIALKIVIRICFSSFIVQWIWYQNIDSQIPGVTTKKFLVYFKCILKMFKFPFEIVISQSFSKRWQNTIPINYNPLSVPVSLREKKSKKFWEPIKRNKKIFSYFFSTGIEFYNIKKTT